MYIFSTLGLEPYGRIGIGVMELIASVLLFPKRTIWLGALLSVGLMAGALFSHLTQLGIEVKNDGGTFLYGFGIMDLGLVVLWDERKNIPFIN